LLLETASRRLFAYNETARQVWDLVEAGRAKDDVVLTYAATWNIPTAHAENDVLSILMEWNGLGLLEGSSSTRASVSDRSPEPVDWRSAAIPSWASEWTSTIRGRAIGFATENGTSVAIYEMFKNLETPGVAPDVKFEIRSALEGYIALVEDGVERLRTRNQAQLAGALFQAVLEKLHSGVHWLALIHGGAVARGGNAIGLCGPSGSGKSTLIAALIGNGFDYLADDMIALSAPSGAIIPLPVPLSVKPGSVKVLSDLHPALSDAVRYRTKGLEARLLVPPIGAWDQEPLPLQKLIFPSFKKGAKAEALRVSAFDAVERLLSERIWLGDPITEERAIAFLNWLHETQCYAISYGSISEGIRLIEEIAS